MFTPLSRQVPYVSLVTARAVPRRRQVARSPIQASPARSFGSATGTELRIISSRSDTDVVARAPMRSRVHRADRGEIAFTCSVGTFSPTNAAPNPVALSTPGIAPAMAGVFPVRPVSPNG